MTQKTHNLPMTVVLLALVEGLAIYINMVAHPDKQQGLTIVIVIIFTIVTGFGTWYATRVRGMMWS